MITLRAGDLTTLLMLFWGKLLKSFLYKLEKKSSNSFHPTFFLVCTLSQLYRCGFVYSYTLIIRVCLNPSWSRRTMFGLCSRCSKLLPSFIIILFWRVIIYLRHHVDITCLRFLEASGHFYDILWMFSFRECGVKAIYTFVYSRGFLFGLCVHI